MIYAAMPEEVTGRRKLRREHSAIDTIGGQPLGGLQASTSPPLG
jgi:hypothetical protein